MPDRVFRVGVDLECGIYKQGDSGSELQAVYNRSDNSARLRALVTSSRRRASPDCASLVPRKDLLESIDMGSYQSTWLVVMLPLEPIVPCLKW